MLTKLKKVYKMTEKNKIKIKRDKKALTIFLMIIPSLLLAMTSVITETYARISFQGILLFFQLVIFKNLLDDYYGTE